MRREAKAWVRVDRLPYIGRGRMEIWGNGPDDDSPESWAQVTVSWDEPDPEPAVGQVWRDLMGETDYEVIAVRDEFTYLRVTDEWDEVEAMRNFPHSAWELVQ